MLDIRAEVHLGDGIWRPCHVVIDKTETGYAADVDFSYRLMNGQNALGVAGSALKLAAKMGITLAKSGLTGHSSAANAAMMRDDWKDLEERVAYIGGGKKIGKGKGTIRFAFSADDVEFTELMDETSPKYYLLSFRCSIYTFRTLFKQEYLSWKKYFGTAV